MKSIKFNPKTLLTIIVLLVILYVSTVVYFLYDNGTVALSDDNPSSYSAFFPYGELLGPGVFQEQSYEANDATLVWSYDMVQPIIKDVYIEDGVLRVKGRFYRDDKWHEAIFILAGEIEAEAISDKEIVEEPNGYLFSPYTAHYEYAAEDGVVYIEDLTAEELEHVLTVGEQISFEYIYSYGNAESLELACPDNYQQHCAQVKISDYYQDLTSEHAYLEDGDVVYVTRTTHILFKLK